MLAEERFAKIITLVETKRSVTVQDLMEQLHTSESTIRRDLTTLHKQGLLVKVFGGAVASEAAFLTKDDEVASRVERNRDEKSRIAEYAAGLVKEDDFVYLDAGTTTEAMIPFLKGKSISVVTNAVTHALKLVQAQCKVYLIGGELKAATEATVGNGALVDLEKYNFNIGFFGTNGVSRKAGFTTPDPEEALVKRRAMEHCRRTYVLADSTKFSQICPITFGCMEESEIITDSVKEESFLNCQNIVEVDKRQQEGRGCR